MYGLILSFSAIINCIITNLVFKCQQLVTDKVVDLEGSSCSFGLHLAFMARFLYVRIKQYYSNLPIANSEANIHTN